MPKNSHTSYPDRVSSTGADTNVRYERQRRRACINSETIANEHIVVGEIEPTVLVIEAAEETIDDLLASDAAVAAYALGDGPVSFAPTGRIFVRVDRDESIEDYVEDLKPLGLVIDMPHPRFQFAAWVASENGNKANALRQCDALLEAAFLVHVEPEMLTMRRASDT